MPLHKLVLSLVLGVIMLTLRFILINRARLIQMDESKEESTLSSATANPTPLTFPRPISKFQRC